MTPANPSSAPPAATVPASVPLPPSMDRAHYPHLSEQEFAAMERMRDALGMEIVQAILSQSINSQRSMAW
jgi:hypothetical protein